VDGRVKPGQDEVGTAIFLRLSLQEVSPDSPEQARESIQKPGQKASQLSASIAPAPREL
jgi:hypothetical protein